MPDNEDAIIICCVELFCEICCRITFDCCFNSCCKDDEPKRTVTSPPTLAVPYNLNTNYGVQQHLNQSSGYAPLQPQSNQPQQYQPIPPIVQQPASAPPMDANSLLSTGAYVDLPPSYSEAVGLEQVQPKVDSQHRPIDSKA